MKHTDQSNSSINRFVEGDIEMNETAMDTHTYYVLQLEQLEKLQTRESEGDKADEGEKSVHNGENETYSSRLGMGKEAQNVPASANLYQKANDILGFDLLDVCTNGPKDKLDSTVISQPAIYVTSLAAVEVLHARDGGQQIIDSVDITCGLSMGEYTSLAFAGTFSFEDGLKLVKLRGEPMQDAADATKSAMVSVIGLDSDKVQLLCDAANEEVDAKDKVCDAANEEVDASSQGDFAIVRSILEEKEGLLSASNSCVLNLDDEVRELREKMERDAKAVQLCFNQEKQTLASHYPLKAKNFATFSINAVYDQVFAKIG